MTFVQSFCAGSEERIALRDSVISCDRSCPEAGAVMGLWIVRMI